jgi:hypothetical protein
MSERTRRTSDTASGAPERSVAPTRPEFSNSTLLQGMSTMQCHAPPQRSSGFDLGAFGQDSLLGHLMANQAPEQELPTLETPEILGRMSEIANMEDGVARNLEITDMYHQTSTMLDQTLFQDPAEQGKTANWNTFAVWASNEAGRAIRGEGNWVMDVGKAVAPKSTLDATQSALATGNREVFAEIAPASAMFAHNFKGDAERDPKKFAAFEEWMRTQAPNRDEKLGNEGLIDAFRIYHEAMFEKDPDRKQELMLQSNAMIGLHEQTRLQPHIEASMPWLARGFLTKNAMTLHTPTNDSGPAGLNFDQNYKALDLSEDVRERNWYGSYEEQYPGALENLEDPGVARTWDQVDPHWWSNPTVGAENWANFDDRMGYISELFRSKQSDPRLHNQPFTQEQKQEKLRQTGR